LRANNGKLYNHPNTNGWYTQPEKSIQLTGDLKNLVIKKGTMKGTYIASFTSELAFTANIQVKFA
jgi:hypothetical protein